MQVRVKSTDSRKRVEFADDTRQCRCVRCAAEQSNRLNLLPTQQLEFLYCDIVACAGVIYAGDTLGGYWCSLYVQVVDA